MQWRADNGLFLQTSSRDYGQSKGPAACHFWFIALCRVVCSLFFDAAVKERLLAYSSTALLFSDRRVDQNVISCNRVMLLHGPPGTGKTTLCKALAQKLAVRLSLRYQQGYLLEINSHSLFSKWFSESGKLIMKLFEKIQEMVEDRDSLICILIDEVESLTAARQMATGTEPTDSIRAVNALLTQLDRLKHYENVLILTTSNITEAIDLAFVDRADIKQFIGLPNVHARYEVLRSCVNELGRVGIITDALPLPDYRAATGGAGAASSQSHAQTLLAIAEKCQGLSGRTLRKLPFQAHAFFVQAPTVSVSSFLAAMVLAVEEEFRNRTALATKDSYPGIPSAASSSSPSPSPSALNGPPARN